MSIQHKKAHKANRKGSVYRKMFLSYSVLFIIPVCIAVLVFSFAYQRIEKQQKATNHNLLQTIQINCDRELAYYQNFLLQMAQDDDVVHLAISKKMNNLSISNHCSDLSKTIQAAVTTLKQFGPYDQEMFVYVPNAGIVVSNGGSRDMEYYLEEYSMIDSKGGKEFLRQYLSQTHFQDIMCYTLQSGEDVFLLTQSAMYNGRKLNTNICLWLDKRVLIDRVSAVNWETGTDWGIIDEEGKFVIKPRQMAGASEWPAEYLEESDSGSIDIRGKNYFVTMMPSKVQNWKYVLIASENQVQSLAAEIRNIFLTAMLFCVIICAWLSKRATAVNYAPVKELVRLFTGQESSKVIVRDEYGYLSQKAATLMQEYSHLSGRVNKINKSLKHYYLMCLVLNAYGNEQNTPAWKEFAEPFSKRKNLVLILSGKWETEKTTQTDAELGAFIIENVFTEALSEHFTCDVAEVNGKIIFVLRLKDLQTEKISILQETVENMQKFILDNFSLTVTAVEGGIHEGVNGVHESWLEACETEDFLPILDQEYLRYVDIQDRTARSYDYSSETEERLVEALKNDNASLARSLVDKVLDNNFRKKDISPDILTCLIYDIFGTLLKTSEEMGRTPGKEFSLKNITINTPVHKLKNHFGRMIEFICQDEKKLFDNAKLQGLCKKVDAYIEEHYADPSLNISKVGLFFNMTPAYLSSLYKKQTGISLLQTIRDVRVNKAMALLKGSMPVAEVAEAVGFDNATTFIRIFKKHTGMTPGQFASRDEKTES